jgi:S-adenosylmethionine:diacylglycerol 3-amino-3-carboxypropyl transferase
VTGEPGSAWTHGPFRRLGRGPQLLFGRMWEDAAIEAQAFPPGSRVFCIASAGCTALALARRGCVVTAVDINPAQIDYVERRLAGGPTERGRADRLLARARKLMPVAGWKHDTLERFCAFRDPCAQERFWDEELDGRRLRAGLAWLLNPLALRAVYTPEFVRALPSRFDQVVRRRLRRTFATHPNLANPFARRLLLGENGEEPAPRGLAIELECADAADYLESAEPGSFDCFALSNILDGASPEYEARLFRAVRRAGAPGLRYVLRSLRKPAEPSEASWAKRDRSLLWGSVRLAFPA